MDFSSSSDRLFIAFGSLRLKSKVPPFEYVRTFNELPVKKIFIRDLHKIFYLRGLPGISTDMIATRDYLQEIREQEKIDKIVIFGGSAGGYAALLMGWLLGADEVHAFSPITFLPTRKGWELPRLAYGGNLRLLFKQLQIKIDPRLPRWQYDLQNILRQDNGRTHYNIYYGAAHKMDVIRSERMDGLPGIRLLAYNTNSHHIDRFLKERDQWSRIFQEAI